MLDNIEKAKAFLINANIAYRSGKPIIEDYEFDNKLEELSNFMSAQEFNEFVNSLHEVKGKIKHPFIMGSLNKLKAEEPDNVKKFLKKIRNLLNISAKIDGISCRLHYENGKLVGASTRGDGSFGEDLTDKISYVNHVPQTIPDANLFGENIDIRGELVILKDDFNQMSGFANARNACAGIMSSKEWSIDDVSKVSFIAYTILGKGFTKASQFNMLNKWNFKTSWNTNVDISFDSIVEDLFYYASMDFEYDTDGLVICDSEYVNEDTYRPEKCMAFKINQQMAETTLIDVLWQGPAKSGQFIPVALLEPVELGGAMISKATLHNLDFIKKMNLKYGSRINILRSGDVIPKVVKLIDTSSGAKDIVPPTHCTCCGSELILDGVNMKCQNPECESKVLIQLTHFIKRLGVKSASEATLKKFNIKTISDLLRFKANPRKKSEVKLESELTMKVFTRSKLDLLKAMNFDNLAETNIEKIVNHYSLAALESCMHDNIFNAMEFRKLINVKGYPIGIGSNLIENFIDGFNDAINKVYMIVNDCRWSYTGSITIEKKNVVGSVCFTGTLNTMSRNEATKLAESNGYIIKGVTKDLTYLVTNNADSGSSKARKAKELGIKVISENEFLDIMNGNVSNIDDL